MSPETFPGESPADRDFLAEPASEESDLKTEVKGEVRAEVQLVAESVEQFERIAKQATTPEQKGKLKSVREKLGNATKKFLQLGRNLSLVGLLALDVDQYVTQYQVEEQGDDHGNTEYVHPDAETSHILNVLAGKESVSLDEAVDNFRAITKVRAQATGMQLPKEYDTYTLDQMDSTMVASSMGKGMEMKRGDLKEYFYDFQYLQRIDMPADEAQEIYDLVWQVEKECGNPKVRFQSKGPGIGGVAVSADSFTAHYDPLENTVYLPMDSFVGQTVGMESFVAELSHAKQRHENPASFYFKGATSMLRILAKGGINADKLSEAQKKEYHIPGSLEYEAHSVIQPKLDEKYIGLTKLKGTSDHLITDKDSDDSKTPKENTAK